MSLSIEAFTDNAEVQQLLASLHAHHVHEKEFSDLIDDEGNQYIDLVQEGGGVLGIALLGYTHVLESMGLRFFSLAGTSAGAINTMMLAARGGVQDTKSTWALGHLVQKNLYDFVDGPKKVRKAIEYMLGGGKALSMRGALRLVPAYRHLKKHLGLNPGDEFHRWIKDILEGESIHTTADLTRRRSALPSLALRHQPTSSVAFTPRLVLISAEVSTETRVQFPAMNALYCDDPDNVHPADFVRASMSIPFFFYPVSLPITNSSDRQQQWADVIRYHGALPSRAVFIDGGIMSNFPIDVFHVRDRIPSRPTFGVKLGNDRDMPKSIESIMNLVGATFNSARHVLDFEFMLRHPDYEHLIAIVDVGEHNWLNFEISDEDKVDLFVRGARAAHDFLLSFDWTAYKGIRHALLPQLLQQPLPLPHVA